MCSGFGGWKKSFRKSFRKQSASAKASAIFRAHSGNHFSEIVASRFPTLFPYLINVTRAPIILTAQLKRSIATVQGLGFRVQDLRLSVFKVKPNALRLEFSDTKCYRGACARKTRKNTAIYRGCAKAQRWSLFILTWLYMTCISSHSARIFASGWPKMLHLAKTRSQYRIWTYAIRLGVMFLHEGSRKAAFPDKNGCSQSCERL